MKAKDKAKELVDKFDKVVNAYTNETLKQCALTTVDEILEELSEVLMVTASSYIVKHVVFWQEVKQEIEKL